MPTQLDKSARGVRYLLGELSEAEEQTFEKSFFADDEVFQDLEITETEVIDAYVANELNDRSRKFFEERLVVSPRLRERVAFAKVFAESAAARTLSHEKTIPPSEDPWWRRLIPVPLAAGGVPAWALAASLIVILGMASVFVQSVRLRNEAQRLASERAELARQREELARLSAEEHDRTASERRETQLRIQRAEELEKALQEQERPTESSIGRRIFASLMLLPGRSLRTGGDSPELPLTRGTSEVRLTLVLPAVDYGTYRSYRVTITSPGDEEIQRKSFRPTRSKTIVLRLPSSLFQPGQHAVKVEGITPTGDVEPVSDYTFRVQN